jgi:hypothetical protein
VNLQARGSFHEGTSISVPRPRVEEEKPEKPEKRDESDAGEPVRRPDAL